MSIDLLVPVLFRLTGILNTLHGLVALLAFSLSFIVYRVADGFIQARKRTSHELKSYNKWYVYLSFAIAFCIVRVFLDMQTSTGIQTFSISSPSMMPTMRPGDKVVASLDHYDQNPIQAGDIVVFNSPQGGIWIFRIIGLPNDTIEVKEGIVYVNNRINELTKSKAYILDHHEVIEFQERLNATKVITTLRFKHAERTDTQLFEAMVVPENEYFLMGDNRDNALDSRFIGTIKKEDILGRVMYSYWGSTSNRKNIDFKSK